VTDRYDVGGRLTAVTDAANRTVRYSYDGLDMTGAEDEQGRRLFAVSYRDRAVAQVIVGNAAAYDFAFAFVGDGSFRRAREATVRAPDGTRTVLKIENGTVRSTVTSR